MKTKKLLLVICIFLIVFSFGLAFCKANAVDTGYVIGKFNGKINGNQESKGIKNALNAIIGALQLAGSGIAIIMITWAGFKYMLASNEAKADVKKQILPIVIGAVLLFGAVALVGILENVGKQFK